MTKQPYIATQGQARQAFEMDGEDYFQLPSAVFHGFVPAGVFREKKNVFDGRRVLRQAFGSAYQERGDEFDELDEQERMARPQSALQDDARTRAYHYCRRR